MRVELPWPDGRFRYSYPDIGRMLGDKDHSTVINAIEKFEHYFQRDRRVRQAYDAAKKALR